MEEQTYASVDSGDEPIQDDDELLLDEFALIAVSVPRQMHVEPHARRRRPRKRKRRRGALDVVALDMGRDTDR